MFLYRVFSMDSCECRVLESGNLVRDIASANLILPPYMCCHCRTGNFHARRRNELRARECEKKMRPTNQTENATNRRTHEALVITRNLFAARFPNQRALINRAIRQVTWWSERWGILCHPGRVHLSILRALAWNAHLCTCSGLTGVDVLKITLVRYLDSLSYPSFRPICMVDTPRPCAWKAQIARAAGKIASRFPFIFGMHLSLGQYCFLDPIWLIKELLKLLKYIKC